MLYTIELWLAIKYVEQKFHIFTFFNFVRNIHKHGSIQRKKLMFAMPRFIQILAVIERRIFQQ